MKDKTPGGLADSIPNSEFSKEQLELGKLVEMEHTDNPALAEEIAKDHLVENREYYTYLQKMENIMDKSSSFRNIKSLDELMTLASFLKKNESIDTHFKQELRERVAVALDENPELTELDKIDPIVAKDLLVDAVLSKIAVELSIEMPDNFKLRIASDIEKQYEEVKKQKGAE